MDMLYIQKVLDGDTESFRYFIKNYKDLAFSVAISVVQDKFWAEEVVQEAFIKAFRNLKSFNGKSSFKTWFYRIVINEAFQKIRDKKKQHLYLEETLYDEEDELEEGFHGMKQEEQEVLVQEALMRMNPKESLLLRLFYFEKQDSKTISEETGWSDANVRVILHRARKNMLAVVQQLMVKNGEKVTRYGRAK